MFLIIVSCLFTAWLQDVGAECPTIISKKEWDGAKPKHIQFLSTPVDLVVIQHTVTQTCSNDQSCADLVRDIQKTHVNNAFLWDIGPSFLIASTGKVYEGRGWNHVAVHTFGFNNQSIGIAFIGNFNNQDPSVKALDAAKALIQCGVDDERLTADYEVVIHSQLVPTESPGKKLANKVKTWPHWKQDVTEIKKRADTQDYNNLLYTEGVDDDSIQSKSASLDLPPSDRSILKTPKQIDTLSNMRDIIAEIIENILKLAQQTLKLLDTLSRDVNRHVTDSVERLYSSLRGYKTQIRNAADVLSLIPGLGQCTNTIKNRANSLYDNTEAKTKACVDKRIREVDRMIKNLGKLSNDAIQLSNTAVEDTRNCTELNYGIESSTKACLNSVTRQTRSATQTYESQRTLALGVIQSSLNALPAALDLCGKQPLLDAATETTRMISQFDNCKPLHLPLQFGW